MPTAREAYAATADAWDVLATAHRGATAVLPGCRAHDSRLPHPGWSGAVATDPSVAPDLVALRAWFAGRGVPWGLRVPDGMPVPAGRLLRRQRLMVVAPGEYSPPAEVPGLVLHDAQPGDLDDVVRVDATAYGHDPAPARLWLAPFLEGGSGVTVLVGRLDDVAVATAYSVTSRGGTCTATYVAGVAVQEHARGRGVGAAVSGRLVADGFAAGAAFAHLNPDDERAARVYRRLGFVEVPGLDIHVDL